MASDEEFTWRPGQTTTREHLAKRYGAEDSKATGSQGGIVPMRPAGMVLVFSDPAKTQEHGYTFDGWAEEDDQGPVFHYTGTGSRGHQVLTGFNGTVLNHQDQQLAVHLFISQTHNWRGPKRQRYVGQMQVDTEQSVLERWAYDREGTFRRVWVFRLRPVDPTTVDQQAVDEAPPAPANAAKRVPASVTSATRVRPEQHATDGTTVPGSGRDRFVDRREGRLSTAFQRYLEAAGHEVNRYQISIKGESGTFMTDLYDTTDDILFEIKGRSRRNDVRMAVAQLLDYRRHIHVPGLRLAVVLPSEPREDVRAFVESLGIALVVKDGDRFAGHPLMP